jgi:pSer/pThr/pTyr-binding forkhead associated (FHA) protein
VQGSSVLKIDMFVWREGRKQARHRLDPGVYRVGRSAENDVVLSSPVVSREHASIVVGADGVFVVDEQSQNGILARGRRVDRRKVDAGDIVCIDPYVLEFRAAPIDERRLEDGDDLVADSARLVALEGHFYRTHIALPTTRVVLGRSETADIIIPDRAVSLNHAEIRNVGGTYVLRDLGSPVGTEVNGARIREACLTHGDRIRIGSTVYWFDVMSRRPVEGEAPSTSDEDTVPLVLL